MKKIFVSLIFLFIGSAAVFSQSVTEQDKKQFKLIITDKKGKPFKNGGVYVYMSGQDAVKMPDNKGLIYFNGVSTNDTLNIIYDQVLYSIPVEEKDSMQIVFKNRSKISNITGYVNGDKPVFIDDGYTKTNVKKNSLAASAVETATLENYHDLATYLQGRVAGVQVVPGPDIRILGVSSINMSTSPLIIVDGAPAGSFAEVNMRIKPRDVKAITVLKDGSLYGNRGANGVLIITTKSGADK